VAAAIGANTQAVQLALVCLFAGVLAGLVTAVAMLACKSLDNERRSEVTPAGSCRKSEAALENAEEEAAKKATEAKAKAEAAAKKEAEEETATEAAEEATGWLRRTYAQCTSGALDETSDSNTEDGDRESEESEDAQAPPYEAFRQIRTFAQQVWRRPSKP